MSATTPSREVVSSPEVAAGAPAVGAPAVGGSTAGERQAQSTTLEPPAGHGAVKTRLAALRGDRDPVWRQLLLIAFLCWLYDMLTELAPTRRALALANGRATLAFERSLGISPELSLDHWLAPQHALALALSDYYDNAHFIVTLGLVGWIWWRRSDVYVPLRDALVLINLVAFAVFLAYPVAPPRLLAGSGFSDVVAATHAIGSWHTGSLAAAADQYAAMPSLHIAWAAWCAVAIWRVTRRWPLRAFGVVHVALTGFIVLATGNHYVLDVIAGLATAALCFGVVALLVRRRTASRATGAERAAVW
ncbi:MAG: phosphatase PAP2 family protein [Solirubrobacteraceae bacterium]